MTTFTTEQRKILTEKKMAMPDGSYPIRNRSDLKNAISSYGRAKNKPAVKAWIIRRAKELNCEDLIPESWGDNIHHLLDGTPYLIHYGVLGMRWGVRRADRYTKKSTKYQQKASDLRNKRLKKGSKYDTKAAKYNKKAAKYQVKVAKALYKGDVDGYVKNSSKQAKYANKAAKLMAKSTKLNSLESKYIYKGEKFLKKSSELKAKYSSV